MTRRSTYQALVLILAIAILLGMLSAAPLERIKYWAIDFGYYRAAAIALRSGADPFLHENLYRYADGAHIDEILGYTYSPLFLYLLQPLTWLPYNLASRVWLIFNLCLLAGSILLLSRSLVWDLTAGRFLVLLLGTVSFVPVIHALVPGQASIFVLFWLAATFYLLKRGQDVWAGICLGLCFTKLQVLALVPLLLLMQKRWRLSGSFALTFLLSVAPFWRLWPNWLEAIERTTRINMEHYGHYNQPCLGALAKVLVTASLPRALLAGISTVCVFSATVWIGMHWGRNEKSPRFDRAFAIAIAASLLTAGYLRTHDLVLLLVPLAVVLNDGRCAVSRSSRKTVSLAFAVLAFVLPYILLMMSQVAPVFRASVWHITSTISVFGGLLITILRESRFQSQHAPDRAQPAQESIRKAQQ